MADHMMNGISVQVPLINNIIVDSIFCCSHIDTHIDTHIAGLREMPKKNKMFKPGGKLATSSTFVMIIGASIRTGANRL